MTYPVPLLMFKDPRGLDLLSFNTIRLGSAWAKRLKKGQRVLLATKTEVVCRAFVSHVYVGPVEEMLAFYAFSNHIERSMCREDGYDFMLAPSRRLESMRKNYGSRLVTPGVKVTVIGLQT